MSAADSSPRPLPPALDLSGRVALVTGASRGIGRAIALVLAERGATVGVNYARQEAAAQEVCGAIEAKGGRTLALGFDVADETAVEAGVKQMVGEFGALDILVNNAGVSIDALLMRAKLEDFETLHRINTRGTFLCCRAAARHLLRAKQNGRIINLTSVVGEQGNVGQAMYAASKAGIIGLTKSIARELASRGVTANAVAPGFIETDMTQSALEGQAREALLAQIPLARVGAADEVAQAVAFLASPGAGYITGHVLRINGGLQT